LTEELRRTQAAPRGEIIADIVTKLHKRPAAASVLAAERTYAAWVRTGLMSLAAGVGAKTTRGGYCRNGYSC
jgi:putative membrane protein